MEINYYCLWVSVKEVEKRTCQPTKNNGLFGSYLCAHCALCLYVKRVDFAFFAGPLARIGWWWRSRWQQWARIWRCYKCSASKRARLARTRCLCLNANSHNNNNNIQLKCYCKVNELQKFCENSKMLLFKFSNRIKCEIKKNSRVKVYKMEMEWYVLQFGLENSMIVWCICCCGCFLYDLQLR